MRFISAARENYTPGRKDSIRYIVVHYTANDGDTAEENLRYFARPGAGASAHYFVDENEVGQSVREEDTAWHCGANSYVHPLCRNANSLGIELCSRIKGGKYYFLPGTLKNAAALIKELAEKYGVKRQNVIRHYDVTGKRCPAPFVEEPAAWELFLDSVFTEQPSDWAKEAADYVIREGIFRGDGNGHYGWKEPLTRQEAAVIIYRLRGGGNA